MASWAPRGRNPDDRPAPRAPGRVNGIRAEIPWRSRGGVSGRSGLVNGAGRVNGSGFVNGSGLVNGAGFVNGSGYVNGLRRRPPLRLNHAGVISRRDLRTGLALAVVLVVGMPTLLILLSPGELALTNIQVDGSPADWDSLGVPLYVDAVDGATGDTSLTRYGHAVREGTVSLAAEVRGTMFGDATGLDGVYFFLDADGDTASGFRLSDLGADRMVRAVGGSGTTQGAYLWDWTGGADQYDWNGWKQGEGLAAAASGRFLEVQGFADDFGLESGYGIRVAVADYSGGAVQSSVRFGAPFGALHVEQRPLATSVTGSAAALLELQFTAFGGPVAVAGVSFGTFSPAWLMNITSIQNLPATVDPLQPAVATVTVDAGFLTPGTYVTLGLPLVTADRPVTLSGTLARAYAGPAPSGKVVDGLFGDWSPADLNSDPAGDAGSPSTDITNWGSNVTAGDFSFYLETPGSLLSGGTILETVGRITSSGGQSQPS
ncbi:MAG TPA: hypothetical protein VJ397_06095, partial [Thermoplasmata archaeon]|nr:hypothetical protein [Thermoplasmata archaeon]